RRGGTIPATLAADSVSTGSMKTICQSVRNHDARESPRSAAILLASGLLLVGCAPPSHAAPATTIDTLPNGIRLAVVHFPGSTNVSIFTFLPMGLVHDGPGQTQWSHLIEHLVIRSTVPANAGWSNAETLPDHMRLDAYGDTANWREHLAHHVRWMEGAPFNAEVLEAEKPKVMLECDFTVRQLATHKFALAAWNQRVRHGRSHAAVRSDVLRAGMEEVREYRDRRLFIPGATTVCLVGGVAADEALPVLTAKLGALSSTSRPPAAVEPATGEVMV
ncbi:MAG TPA: hypothetical protein DCY13_18940, partial [Verrucomicrobiales bacterium]|nr:hypothetical protein [Verrucomicrobiales bacterium]